MTSTALLVEAADVRAGQRALDVACGQGDAEQLPEPDASYDVVLSTVGVMFAPDHQRAADELVRVTKPGGKIALAFEQSWTLGCQLNDPCWEGMAGRGLGLLSADRGDYGSAVEWLDQAIKRCSREPDRYQWVYAHVLDAAIDLALDRSDDERARRLLPRLTALAARCDMRELIVRAHLHAARLGDARAAVAARSIAAGIDNPALTPLVR